MTERENHEHASSTPGRSHLSPRQGEMLELAAQGLSDEAIARRLHLSDRGLRTELERVLTKLGVRDRERAITVWSGSAIEPRFRRDRCPYHRPFPRGFSECVAYRPRHVATVDLNGQPTGSIWTCRNLTAYPRPPDEMGQYAACAVGRPADRERWSAEQPEPDRRRVVDSLTETLASLISPFARRLWDLKQQQRLSVSAGGDPAGMTGAIAALSDRFMHDLTRMLAEQRPQLDRYGLPAEDCVSVARQLIALIVPELAPANWDDRFDRLLRLPEEAWAW